MLWVTTLNYTNAGKKKPSGASAGTAGGSRVAAQQSVTIKVDPGERTS